MLKTTKIPHLYSPINNIPHNGGIAIFIGLMVGNCIFSNTIILPLCIMIFSLGLLDDIICLKWHNKLLAQTIICIYVQSTGWHLQWFDNVWMDNLVGLIWLVGLTNSFNLLDNMDGLCGGTVIIISWGVFVITGDWNLLIVIMAVGGFIIYNYPKGSLWMGDGGSLLLGLLMAVKMGELHKVNTSLWLMLLPILDTTFVIIRRLWVGKKPWRGGTDHLSHWLVQLGLNNHQAVLTLWSISLLATLKGIGENP